MGLASLRKTWKEDRIWGNSVPVVPEDHVEIPRKGIFRFTGNHGAWMTPVGMIALALCLLATIGTPIFAPMSLVDFTIKGDVPGGSGTPRTLQVGLWGFCWNGPDG